MRRKRGRPPGSKNKVQRGRPPMKRRGRPPGSGRTSTQYAGKRGRPVGRRGRPAGSKNRPTMGAAMQGSGSLMEIVTNLASTALELCANYHTLAQRFADSKDLDDSVAGVEASQKAVKLDKKLRKTSAKLQVANGPEIQLDEEVMDTPEAPEEEATPEDTTLDELLEE